MYKSKHIKVVNNDYNCNIMHYGKISAKTMCDVMR